MKSEVSEKKVNVRMPQLFMLVELDINKVVIVIILIKLLLKKEKNTNLANPRYMNT